VSGLTAGDILYADSAGVAQRLAKPIDGAYGVVWASGAPSWAALGGAGLLDVGTTAGTVAAGDDARIAGAQQTSEKDQPGGYVGLDQDGNVAIDTTLPTDAPAGSIGTGGRIYGDLAVRPAPFSGYYVDPVNGNDGNVGTSPATAWQTTGKADATVLAAGQRVALRSVLDTMTSTPGADTDLFQTQPTWVEMRNGPWTNYESSAGTVFEEFEADWTKGSGETTSITQNSDEYFKSNTGSLKLVSTDGTNVQANKVINSVVSGMVSLWVYLPWDATNESTASVQVFFASQANFSKYFGTGFTGLHRGWNYLTVAPSMWTNNNGDSWDNTMVRLRVNLVTGGQARTIYVDELRLDVARRPKVLVTFDHTYTSQYTEGFAYMRPLGIPGTLYTTGGRPGSGPDYMTIAQMREMYDAGWDAAIHTDTTLPTLGGVAEQRASVEESLRWHWNQGFIRGTTHFAYHGGAYDENSPTALAQLGFLTGRTTADRLQGNVIDERYAITRYGIVNTTTLDSTKLMLDRAILTGTSIQFNFHFLVTSPTISTQWSIANFRALMDYIKTKMDAGLIDAVTISEWYRGLYE
jgi:peptidoglycan/xylan/chitin deacetylase (PgdA/CDA1 family)